jgi:microcystin-dependent protein
MSALEPKLPRRHFLSRSLAAVAGLVGLARADREAEAQTDSPYVGEIRMFAGDFAPVGWALCNGQLLSISGNDALFNLIGTTYGGDGQSTFALPDLRSRAPVHMGTGSGLPSWTIGQTGGVETVTLTATQIPSHTHLTGASAALGDSDNPAGRVPAADAAGTPHFAGTTDVSLGSGALASAGGSGAHNNLQPYLALNFIISLYGIYPTPT